MLSNISEACVEKQSMFEDDIEIDEEVDEDGNTNKQSYTQRHQIICFYRRRFIKRKGGTARKRIQTPTATIGA